MHIESTPPAAILRSRNTREPQQEAALMRCSTTHVCLDVHQATTLWVVRDVNGRTIAQSILGDPGETLGKRVHWTAATST